MEKVMNVSLNEKLTVNVGDVVWYLAPKHTHEPDVNKRKIYFNDIRQGKVTSISGATDCNPSVNITDINNEMQGAVQELFFTHFNDCLNVFQAVQGMRFGVKNDWYTEYMAAAGHLINYKYEINIPYEKETVVNVTRDGIGYPAIMKRTIFNLGQTIYGRDRVDIQVLIEEKRLSVSLDEKELPRLKEAKVRIR